MTSLVFTLAAAAVLATQPAAASPPCSGPSPIPAVFTPDLSSLRTASGPVGKGGELLSVRVRHRQLGRLASEVDFGWIELPQDTILYRSNFDLRQTWFPVFPLPLGVTTGQRAPAETWCGMGRRRMAWGPPKPQPVCLVLAESGPALHVAGSAVYNERLQATPHTHSAYKVPPQIVPVEADGSMEEVRWSLTLRGIDGRSRKVATEWRLVAAGKELARGFSQATFGESRGLSIPELGIVLQVADGDGAMQVRTGEACRS